MKLRITGASNFVNRMFEACGTYQWAREFLKNSIEAGATKIEFGIEWQAVERRGVYRRVIADNGSGMDRDELLRFFSTLGEGAKKIGGVHENFGVGAKIASLPWNPEGVVVISYENGRGAMIWIMLDSESGDYELVEFQIGDQKTCVIEPGEVEDIDWSLIRPEWLKEHGTVVVLLGSEEYPDTVLGNPHTGEKDIKGVSVYLNSRFWDLTNFDVRVLELRSDKKAQWPQGPQDRDDARRPNNRQIMGAMYYLTEIQSAKGKLADANFVMLDNSRVLAEWYLWDGERPAIHSYAKKNGYIAIRYKGELFQLTASKVHFRAFGIIESEVQQNLTIVLDPQLYQANNGRWGVHPDQSRNRLIFTGNGEKGVDIPLADWGLEFAEKMPDAIREAIRNARGEGSGSIEDEEYRKRLQDKFGARWTTKGWVKFSKRKQDPQPVTLDDTDAADVVGDLPQGEPAIRRPQRKTVKLVVKRGTPAGPHDGVLGDVPVDVPKYRFAHSGDFEKTWHVALWAPNDTEGPTVLINVDSPILQEIVEHHQSQYPDVYAEEVATTIRKVFGEVASCKIAHSQKLLTRVSEQELDQYYRSEQALTVALMGLLAEESLISQRLGRLGRKKPAATTSSESEAVTV
jgi:hypothetical protein